jgi:hypothetical protein
VCARVFSYLYSLHSFYRRMATPSRTYHYVVDLKGRLYLQGQPRSPLRDLHFLDFFFKRITKPEPADNAPPGVNWISRCGREVNYIHCADTPIVFKDITHDLTTLHYAGTLTEPFLASNLVMCLSTQRLYYHAQTSPPAAKVGLCLLASGVAFELSKKIILHEDGNCEFEGLGRRITTRKSRP